MPVFFSPYFFLEAHGFSRFELGYEFMSRSQTFLGLSIVSLAILGKGLKPGFQSMNPSSVTSKLCDLGHNVRPL